MKLDEIISKYGMHALDIDLCKKNEDGCVVYAYCHEHNANGEFMVNHWLEIKGVFRIIDMDECDENDIFLHIAWIDKCEDGTYEIAGVGGLIHFAVEGDLTVRELGENEYDEITRVDN